MHGGEEVGEGVGKEARPLAGQEQPPQGTLERGELPKAQQGGDPGSVGRMPLDSAAGLGRGLQGPAVRDTGARNLTLCGCRQRWVEDSRGGFHL